MIENTLENKVLFFWDKWGKDIKYKSKESILSLLNQPCLMNCFLTFIENEKSEINNDYKGLSVAKQIEYNWSDLIFLHNFAN